MATSGDTEPALGRLRAFLLPGGEAAARGVRAMTASERGEIRSAPRARAIPFTAQESIDATQSAFRWDARMAGGKLGLFRVTDAYEEQRGRLVITVGGVVPLKKMTGPDFDKGELQRYLAYAVFCPPILVNNPALEWTAAGDDCVRVRDRTDPTGATVDIEIDADGRPVVMRALRPREKGVETPWSAVATDFEEHDGARVPRRLAASWHLPEGSFTYINLEIASFAFVR